RPQVLVRRNERPRPGDPLPRSAVRPPARRLPLLRGVPVVRAGGGRRGCPPAQVRARSPSALGRRFGIARARHRAQVRAALMSARSKELLGLLPVSLLVTAGFTAVLIARTGANINKATITYGAVFLGACLVGHLFIR